MATKNKPNRVKERDKIIARYKAGVALSTLLYEQSTHIKFNEFIDWLNSELDKEDEKDGIKTRRY